MSLILEALKQADSERGRGSVPGVFSQPIPATEQPARASRRSPLVWLLVAATGAALLWRAWPHTPWGERPNTNTQTTLPAPAPAPSPVAAPPQVPPANAALFQSEPMAATPPATPAAPAALPAPTAVLPPAHTPAPLAVPPAPSITDLPAETRAQLPSVQISGHTYSDHAALRTLMIDGRMVMEGQAVSPGLRVERIGPHQAVFSHRGARFSVDY